MPKSILPSVTNLIDVANTEAVLQRCSIKKAVLKNFRKIQRKTPVPESLF